MGMVLLGNKTAQESKNALYQHRKVSEEAA
jgi:hypothetical protein